MGDIKISTMKDDEIYIDAWSFPPFCVVCGSPDVETHHVLHGFGRRAKAEKWGYKIPLCRRHHTGVDGIHQARNRQYDLLWIRAAQRHFERRRGTREDWIREFGKSWMED